MKKCLVAMLVSGLAYSQVGINTQTPKSTLDVMIHPTISKPEGIIAPRMTGDALRSRDLLYTTDQNAALVYVTLADTAPAGKTINVTSPGYYYFDAAVTNTWIKLGTGGTSVPAGPTPAAWYPGGNTESSEKTLGTNNNFDLPFVTNGTEKARLTTTGYLGVGTSAPEHGIHLVSTTASQTADNITITSAVNPAFVAIQTTPTAGKALGSMQFQGKDVAAMKAGIYSTVEASAATSSLEFHTSNTEQVRIDGKGFVGVGTQTPQATLDITAKTTDGTQPEGLLLPRLTGDQIKAGDAQYNAAQKGTLVYATSSVSTTSLKTMNITRAGYYFFDGFVWQKLKDPYQEPWQISGTTTPATSNTSDIYQMGKIGIGTISPFGAIDIVAESGNNIDVDEIRITSYYGGPSLHLQHSAGTSSAPISLSNGNELGSIVFGGQAGGSMQNNMAFIQSSYKGNGTTTKADLRFFTSATFRMAIDENGKVGIGIPTPTQALDVAGNIKASGSLISGTTTYPDYVFENYYKGTSEINPAYQFKRLDEVETFIKERGHLPGYKSLDEVKKNDMNVDVTQNSITNMEKIEELYLHIIELNKKIKMLEDKIKS